MKIINTIIQLRKYLQKLRKHNKSVGFVPTMGALHEGHTALIRKAKMENDIVVVSIFVNPVQFLPGEDYRRYPRPFKKDVKICKRENVDILFNPSADEMYPGEHYLTYVNVEVLSDMYCGKYRPGHFKGVATVVTKLFNIVQPDRAYFGQKDYQQLKIIEKMTYDLNFPVKIVSVETEREKDGLAISSRNIYLKKYQKDKAHLIYKALLKLKYLIESGEVKNRTQAISIFKKIVNDIPDSKIQYFEICNPENLIAYRDRIKLPARILTAVFVGSARLIDNIEVG